MSGKGRLVSFKRSHLYLERTGDAFYSWVKGKVWYSRLMELGLSVHEPKEGEGEKREIRAIQGPLTDVRL